MLNLVSKLSVESGCSTRVRSNHRYVRPRWIIPAWEGNYSFYSDISPIFQFPVILHDVQYSKREVAINAGDEKNQPGKDNRQSVMDITVGLFCLILACCCSICGIALLARGMTRGTGTNARTIWTLAGGCVLLTLCPVLVWHGLDLILGRYLTVTHQIIPPSPATSHSTPAN